MLGADYEKKEKEVQLWKNEKEVNIDNKTNAMVIIVILLIVPLKEKNYLWLLIVPSKEKKILYDLAAIVDGCSNNQLTDIFYEHVNIWSFC